MCEIQVQVKCPHCLSAKVVKNGKKSTGCQNFLRQGCQKQFQYEYLYQGANPEEKAKMTHCLLHGDGFEIQQKYVLRVLKQ